MVNIVINANTLKEAKKISRLMNKRNKDKAYKNKITSYNLILINTGKLFKIGSRKAYYFKTKSVKKPRQDYRLEDSLVKLLRLKAKEKNVKLFNRKRFGYGSEIKTKTNLGNEGLIILDFGRSRYEKYHKKSDKDYASYKEHPGRAKGNAGIWNIQTKKLIETPYDNPQEIVNYITKSW